MGIFCEAWGGVGKLWFLILVRFRPPLKVGVLGGWIDDPFGYAPLDRLGAGRAGSLAMLFLLWFAG